MRLGCLFTLLVFSLTTFGQTDSYRCHFSTSYTGAPSYSFQWDGSVPKKFSKGSQPGVAIRFDKGTDPFTPQKLTMTVEVFTKGAKFETRETVYRGQKSIKSAFRSYRDKRIHTASVSCTNSSGSLTVYKKPPEGRKFLCDAQLAVDHDMGSVSYTIDPFRSGTQSVSFPVGNGRLEVRPQISRRSVTGGYTYIYTHSLYYRASNQYCYMGESGGMDVSQGDFESEFLAPQYSEVCPDFGLIRCRWSKPPWPPQAN